MFLWTACRSKLTQRMRLALFTRVPLGQVSRGPAPNFPWEIWRCCVIAPAPDFNDFRRRLIRLWRKNLISAIKANVFNLCNQGMLHFATVPKLLKPELPWENIKVFFGTSEILRNGFVYSFRVSSYFSNAFFQLAKETTSLNQNSLRFRVKHRLCFCKLIFQ